MAIAKVIVASYKRFLILDCGVYCPMKQINIDLWRNDESQDWSIEINGLRHEHVTSEIMEDLVECALIVAERTLTEASTRQGL